MMKKNAVLLLNAFLKEASKHYPDYVHFNTSGFLKGDYLEEISENQRIADNHPFVLLREEARSTARESYSRQTEKFLLFNDDSISMPVYRILELSGIILNRNLRYERNPNQQRISELVSYGRDVDDVGMDNRNMLRKLVSRESMVSVIEDSDFPFSAWGWVIERFKKRGMVSQEYSAITPVFAVPTAGFAGETEERRKEIEKIIFDFQAINASYRGRVFGRAISEGEYLKAKIKAAERMKKPYLTAK